MPAPGRSQVAWRQLSEEERSGLSRAIGGHSARRLAFGLRKFGAALAGDALDHAEEELIDALHYVAWSRRERYALRRRVAALEALCRTHGVPVPPSDVDAAGHFDGLALGGYSFHNVKPNVGGMMVYANADGVIVPERSRAVDCSMVEQPAEYVEREWTSWSSVRQFVLRCAGTYRSG